MTARDWFRQYLAVEPPEIEYPFAGHRTWRCPPCQVQWWSASRRCWNCGEHTGETGAWASPTN